MELMIIGAVAAVAAALFGVAQAWPSLTNESLKDWLSHKLYHSPKTATVDGLPEKRWTEWHLSPPNIPATFVSLRSGRGKLEEQIIFELVRASRALRPRPVNLSGWPGSGKSTHAAHIADDPRIRAAYADGVAWIPSAGREFENICRHLARGLGLTSIAELVNDEEMAQALRSECRERRLLLLLDNVDSPEIAERFHREVSSRTLVTSRSQIAGTQVHILDSFLPNESLQFFALALGATNDAQSLSDRSAIADILGHLPLALSLIAPLMFGDLTTIFADLKIRVPSQAGGPGFLAPLHAAFELSWARLTPELQLAFASLGTFGSTFSLGASSRIIGDHLPILELTRLSLCRQVDVNHYDVHPLLLQFARQKLNSPGPILSSLSFWREWIENLSESPEGGQQFEQELPNLLFLARCLDPAVPNPFPFLPRTSFPLSSRYEAFCALGASLHRRMLKYGYWAVWERVVDNGLKQARKMRNSQAIADWTLRRASLYQRQGKVRLARPMFRRCLGLFRKIGDQQSLVDALHNLGICEMQLYGDLNAAEPLFSQALALSSGPAAELQRARALHQLAMVAHFRGDWDTARRLYDDSRRLSSSIKDMELIAKGLIQLALLDIDLNRHDSAWELLCEALQVSLSDKETPNVTHAFYGLACVGTLRVAEAKDLLAAALDYATRGRSDGLAIDIYFKWSQLSTSEENIEETRCVLKKAFSRASSLGLSREIARSLLRLGDVELKAGNLPSAYNYYVDYISSMRKLSKDWNDRTRQALRNIAMILTLTGYSEKSAKLLKELIRQAERRSESEELELLKKYLSHAQSSFEDRDHHSDVSVE